MCLARHRRCETETAVMLTLSMRVQTSEPDRIPCDVPAQEQPAEAAAISSGSNHKPTIYFARCWHLHRHRGIGAENVDVTENRGGFVDNRYLPIQHNQYTTLLGVVTEGRRGRRARATCEVSCGGWRLDAARYTDCKADGSKGCGS
jgi:hypothetical protein